MESLTNKVNHMNGNKLFAVEGVENAHWMGGNGAKLYNELLSLNTTNSEADRFLSCCMHVTKVSVFS